MPQKCDDETQNAFCARLIEVHGWNLAIEAAAAEADKWATDFQRQYGNGGPAAAIRALKRED